MRTQIEILESKYFTDQVIFNKNGILQAMDEYAKEVAIEFAEWRDINCVFYDAWHFKMPLADKYDSIYTTSELYDIFINEINQKK